MLAVAHLAAAFVFVGFALVAWGPCLAMLSGSVIGGWAAGNFGLSRMLTWVVAILAAIVLLFLFEAMRKKR